jgi:hypothetical protein
MNLENLGIQELGDSRIQELEFGINPILNS